MTNLKKIPCLKCGGNISHWVGSRLECLNCGQQFKYHKIKKIKRRLSKKCVTCGKQFKNSHSSILNCSEKCSIKYRKKWFKKYNKNHQSEINKSRKKYERKNPKRIKYHLKTK